MKVMFEPKEGTDQPVGGIDILSHSEIDDVVNYMRMGMHDRVAAKKRRAMVTSPHWWDDKMLVTGKYEKDEFVARVMDHIADQYDGPVGSDPPTWDFPRMGVDSDSHQPEAGKFPKIIGGKCTPRRGRRHIGRGEVGIGHRIGLYRSAVGCIHTEASG